jgi:PBP1b-binding outer membrane lipoprotein LpoB
MKKLYLIILLLFTALIVSGCAEQIIAIPRAGVNFIGNTASAIWHLLTGWI